MNRLRTIGLLAALGATWTAYSQSTTFSVDVPLVSLDVGVTDPAGRALTSLTQEDFQIFEDGKPQEIKNFSAVETPYNVLALFDCTGSTREAWPFLLKALNGFLGTLRTQDRVAVTAFGRGTSTILNWTARSAQPLNVQMKMPSPLCDQTDFYGAVTWATRKLREVEGRKGVILFTDGVHGGIPSKPVVIAGTTLFRFVDPSQDAGFRAVRTAVERSDAVFYFIAVNTDLNPVSVEARDLAPGTEYTPLSLFNLQQVRSRMEQIAQASGGRIVFPQKYSDAGLLFDQIVRELGTSYSLSVTPAARLDGEFHRIEVRVRGEGVKVRQSRDGYFAR
jgi:Ca-activated chloride channel homolog